MTRKGKPGHGSVVELIIVRWDQNHGEPEMLGVWRFCARHLTL